MERPDTRSSRTRGAGRLGPRLLVFWPVKAIGLTCGMTAFFVVYFWILHHPTATPRVMPLTAIDHWIGFSPAALPFYLSLWIYVSLAPSLLVRRGMLVAYGASALLLASLGLLVFFVWPSSVPAMDVDWSRHPGFAFLKNVDASGNACPSLHAGFAVFTAIWMHHVFQCAEARFLPRVLNFLWCVAILYSTLATRQHVVIDAASGAALGGVTAMAGVSFRRLTQSNTSDSAGGTTQR